MKINLDRYQIFLESGIINNLDGYIKKYYSLKRVFIITDENLFTLYHDKLNQILKNFQVEWVVIKPGEESKSLVGYETVINQLLELKMSRQHLIIAFGGGVVGDLAGFVAATIFRGVKYFQIPTSLLAMVDSSVGAKVGINTAVGKNLIGSFYHPKVVLIDDELLNTLPPIEYSNGMAELIKAALIGDRKLFDELGHKKKVNLEDIYRAIKVKSKIVNKDPFEQYERKYLNFGHSFGHAIEVDSQYQIKHGFAVALGMIVAVRIGIKTGRTNNVLKQVKEVLIFHDLIKEEDVEIDYKRYVPQLIFDKKSVDGKIDFVFIEDIGKPFLCSVEIDKL
jgi:3-dehydroquinate synthase